MNNIIRNFFAFSGGIALGILANFATLVLCMRIIPPPDGIDTSTQEGIRLAMEASEPKHFIAPLLAHAVGSFVAGMISAILAKSHKYIIAIGIGSFFLISGVIGVVQYNSPFWFNIVDIGLCYIPMVLLGSLVGQRVKR